MGLGAQLIESANMTSGKELQTAGAVSAAQHEIEAPLIVAKKFPRNEVECFQELMTACSRASFAEEARYSFPRGETEVTGPSVNLAREAGRIWGNVEFGLHIIRDDEDSMLIRGWAWDKQKNVRVGHEDSFKKLIQRKGKGWIVPDERDLRELVNRRGAILVRNSLLQIMPKDLIEDALYQCSKTLEKAAGDNPEATRKRLLVDFGAVNVTVAQIETKLGRPFSQASAKEIVELRGICTSIQEGNSTWNEYVKGPEGKPAEQSAESKANEEALAAGQEALAKQQEQPKQETKAEEKKDPMTCKKACELLGMAQSVAEIAKTMNAWGDSTSTSEERKTVLDHKDMAMRRLAPSKKK